MKHEPTREEGAEESASLSQSRVSGVLCGAQWESSRTATLLLSHLQDVLWGDARNADVWVEDGCFGGSPSAVDPDATRQLASSRRDHGTQIRDDRRMAQAGSQPRSRDDTGASQRAASESG